MLHNTVNSEQITEKHFWLGHTQEQDEQMVMMRFLRMLLWVVAESKS